MGFRKKGKEIISGRKTLHPKGRGVDWFASCLGYDSVSSLASENGYNSPEEMANSKGFSTVEEFFLAPGFAARMDRVRKQKK
jgi:hypothetical protein